MNWYMSIYAGSVEKPSIGAAKVNAVIFTANKNLLARWVLAYCVEYKSSFMTTPLRKYLWDIKALGHKVRELVGSRSKQEGF